MKFTADGKAGVDSYDAHRFIVDLNTPGGKATYSMALAARINGQSIGITDTTSCAVWGDTETVSLIGY